MYDVTGAADLWIDPQTGEGLRRRPFLRKVRNKALYKCRIYDTRPLMCQRFPHLEYSENGDLVGVHPWVLDNCPGVRAILKAWTPEQVQALRDLIEKKKRADLERQSPERSDPIVPNL